MPETVTYRSLQDVVVRAGRRFPDTQFFLSKDPAMPYVLGRDLHRLCGRFGSKVRRGGVSARAEDREDPALHSGRRGPHTVHRLRRLKPNIGKTTPDRASLSGVVVFARSLINKKSCSRNGCRIFWSCYPDSDRGPHPYQGCALPTEL